MPVLNWIGKDAVVRHDAEVPFRLLHDVPELSSLPAPRGNSPPPLAGEGGASVASTGGGQPAANTTDNLIVEGDNLLALKALLPHYGGQVKCIYIDPPYNTGNEGWVYNDNVNSPEMREWLGKVVGKEAEDLTRHDKWLCMMYPRLKLLKRFLREDGAIFVSIDEIEVGTLECLMSEIFGATNRLGIFSWQRKKKGSHLDAHMRKMSEFVLCYASEKRSLSSLYGEDAYSEKLQPLVKRTNKVKVLRFPANIVLTALSDGSYAAGFRGKEGTGLRFVEPFAVADGCVVSPLVVEGRFVWTQEKLDEELAVGSTIELSKKYGLNSGRHDQAEKTKTPTGFYPDSTDTSK